VDVLLVGRWLLGGKRGELVLNALDHPSVRIASSTETKFRVEAYKKSRTPTTIQWIRAAKLRRT